MVDPLLPGCPSPHYNLLITAVPLREKKGRGEGLFATGLAALGGAVAKGRALLSDGWIDGLLVGATYRSTKCDEANLSKLLEVPQTMFSVTICCFIISPK